MVNTTLIIEFLSGGSLVAALLMQLLKSTLNGISARFGALASQVLLAVISLLVALGLLGVGFLPQWFLASAGAVFAGSMMLYEVLYKAVICNAILGKSK